MPSAGALTMPLGTAHLRLPQLSQALLGTGPGAPALRLGHCAAEPLRPWCWVWCWAQHAAEPARRSTRPDARAPLSICHGVGAGPLPPRRRRTATCSFGIRAGSTGAAPPPAQDHDEQRPHRTATHDAARTPPPPPPPLGARLGQGMSWSKPRSGRGVDCRMGVAPRPTPRGGHPQQASLPPADDHGPTGHCAATQPPTPSPHFPRPFPRCSQGLRETTRP